MFREMSQHTRLTSTRNVMLGCIIYTLLAITNTIGLVKHKSTHTFWPNSLIMKSILYKGNFQGSLCYVIDDIVLYLFLYDVGCRHGVVSGVDASEWLDSIRVRYYSSRFSYHIGYFVARQACMPFCGFFHVLFNSKDVF